MNKIIAISIVICIVMISACTNQSNPTPPSQTDEHSTTTINPADLYKANCVVCHGADGTMGMNGAKNLKESTLSKEQIVKQVTYGKGMMVGFEGKLSALEIHQLATYIQTFR